MSGCRSCGDSTIPTTVVAGDGTAVTATVTLSGTSYAVNSTVAANSFGSSGSMVVADLGPSGVSTSVTSVVTVTDPNTATGSAAEAIVVSSVTVTASTSGGAVIGVYADTVDPPTSLRVSPGVDTDMSDWVDTFPVGAALSVPAGGSAAATIAVRVANLAAVGAVTDITVEIAYEVLVAGVA